MLKRLFRWVTFGWGGLFSEGFIFGGAYYRNFTVTCLPSLGVFRYFFLLTFSFCWGSWIRQISRGYQNIHEFKTNHSIEMKLQTIVFSSAWHTNSSDDNINCSTNKLINKTAVVWSLPEPKCLPGRIVNKNWDSVLFIVEHSTLSSIVCLYRAKIRLFISTLTNNAHSCKESCSKSGLFSLFMKLSVCKDDKKYDITQSGVDFNDTRRYAYTRPCLSRSF